jgi:hypothetical protein
MEQRLQQAPDSIDWVLRMPWQQTQADYHIARSAGPEACSAAQSLHDLAAGPGECTYGGLALLQLAESALNPEDRIAFLHKAQALVVKAPVAAWQVYTALAQYWMQCDKAEAAACKAAGAQVLQQLSDSLQNYPAQQAQFITALEQRGLIRG